MDRALTIPEAREIQLKLRERLVFQTPADFNPRLVAGADVAFDKSRGLAFAAVVLIDLNSMETIETSVADVPVGFPYVPGYLSFRELPALEEAWEKLNQTPDIAVLDAHGYAHPRRMGLACHAGVVFGVPTVGCAKSILCGTMEPLAEERGARSSLIDPRDREELGRALRTRTRVRPSMYQWAIASTFPLRPNWF
jgi:deoxyribonuclease V